MTIDEAIEIQEQYLKQKQTHLCDDLDDSIRLGQEALKRCKERSDRFPNLPHLRLPGETLEIDTKRSLHHIKRTLESPLGRESGQ